MIYTDLFKKKRIEYYQDIGIQPNCCLMSSKFCRHLQLENNIQLWTGKMFQGIEIIMVYNKNPGTTIQFFQKIN